MAHIGMARHSDSSFNEGRATRLLAEYLEQNSKIKTFFKENDRTPNYDGSMELVSADGEPTKQFIVQIKKVENLTANVQGKNKGRFVYELETNFLYYVKAKVTESPAIYFVVDIATNNIFWLYLSDDLLMSLNFEGKERVSYPFSTSNIISNIDDFAKELNDIAEVRNRLFLQKTPEEIAEMQEALDYINGLMDNHLKVIKEATFPNLWRFGINHSHSDSFQITVGGKTNTSDDTALFSLYPQIKGVPDTGLGEFRGNKDDYYRFFDLKGTTSPSKYVKDCLEKLVKNFFENGIPIQYLPDILLCEKIGEYVRKLKKLIAFPLNDGKIHIDQLYRASSMLVKYMQYIITTPTLEADELVVRTEWLDLLKYGKANIIDVFNYSSRLKAGFNRFCALHSAERDILFSEKMFQIVRKEHLEAWVMIATLQERKTIYYDDVWNYDFFDIVRLAPEQAVCEIDRICTSWFSSLIDIYHEVYEAIFDSNKYLMQGRYTFKNNYISNGKCGPWLSSTICMYESRGLSICHDINCPETLDVENAPTSISRGGNLEEFLMHKTPLYDGVHCLLYAGLRKGLGLREKGLTFRHRTIHLL